MTVNGNQARAGDYDDMIPNLPAPPAPPTLPTFPGPYVITLPATKKRLGRTYHNVVGFDFVGNRLVMDRDEGSGISVVCVPDVTKYDEIRIERDR